MKGKSCETFDIIVYTKYVVSLNFDFGGGGGGVQPGTPSPQGAIL
jgi:hypothetical protein